MRKIVLMFLACIFSNISYAQVGGGFVGPDGSVPAVITIQEALKLSDNTRVTLQGQIVNKLGDEKYTFKDATGEVVIEIDDEDWKGINVTPENTLIISGEIDKEVFEATKVDVDSFTIKN